MDPLGIKPNPYKPKYDDNLQDPSAADAKPKAKDPATGLADGASNAVAGTTKSPLTYDATTWGKYQDEQWKANIKKFYELAPEVAEGPQNLLKPLAESYVILVEQERAEQQIRHNERDTLVLAGHHCHQMPKGLWTNLPRVMGMSTYGKTLRFDSKGNDTDTFRKLTNEFEGSVAKTPGAKEAIDKRLQDDKTVALKLGVRSQKDVDRLLDPKNQSDAAKEFRARWDDPKDATFRIAALSVAWEGDHQDVEPDSKALWLADTKAAGVKP